MATGNVSKTVSKSCGEMHPWELDPRPVTLGEYIRKKWSKEDIEALQSTPFLSLTEDERLDRALSYYCRSWRVGCNSHAWLDEKRNQLAKASKKKVDDMSIQDLIVLARTLRRHEDASQIGLHRRDEKKPLRLPGLAGAGGQHFSKVPETTKQRIIQWCQRHPEEAKHAPCLSYFLQYHGVAAPWEEDKSSRPSLAFLIGVCCKEGIAPDAIIDQSTGDLTAPTQEDNGWSTCAEDGWEASCSSLGISPQSHGRNETSAMMQSLQVPAGQTPDSVRRAEELAKIGQWTEMPETCNSNSYWDRAGWHNVEWQRMELDRVAQSNEWAKKNNSGWSWTESSWLGEPETGGFGNHETRSGRKSRRGRSGTRCSR